MEKKKNEGGGISSFVLKPEDKLPIPDFKPGQFLTFSLNVESEAKPVVRCYSLSDAPNGEYYRVSIKKALAPRDTDFPNGISSSFFHENVIAGDVLSVKAPNGDFYLDVNAKGAVVLIAGGVGITPVLSMAKTLAKMKSQREIHFFYGATTGKDLAHKDEMEALRKDLPNLKIYYCLSRVKKREQKAEKPAGSKPKKTQMRYFLEVPSLDCEVNIPNFGGVVGRTSESAEIAIESRLISRRHAQITKEDGDWYVMDLESRNGSALNGEKLDDKKHKLKDGDELDFSLNKPLKCIFRAQEVEVADDMDVTLVSDALPPKDDYPDFDFVSGRISADLFKDVLPSNNYDYYLCGSIPLMNSVTEGLKEWGVPSAKVHFESFGPGSPTKKKKTELKNKLTINFTKSNKTLDWDGSHDSILDLAESEGLELNSSCRGGSCGSCVVRVLEGKVKYDSEPSATVGEDECLACVGMPSENMKIEA
ncbi:MAG: FHA domain-containing protein [Lentisphaeraceae bacterium]|nr:FHA domain-containing protein [Lentisphaeraceae bacterium]